MGILLAILAYQFIGTGIEWVMTQNFFVAVQDFRMGIPNVDPTLWRLFRIEGIGQSISLQHANGKVI